MASKLNIIGVCNEIESTLPCQEYALGKGLMQPFNNCNSGSRKIMQGIQEDQTMQLSVSETPIIMTGYENQFGEHSSTFKRAERDMVVVGKVSKYNVNYRVKSSNFTLICLDAKDNVVDVIDRIDYRHISESYGYRMDTSGVDALQVGDAIPKNTPIVKCNSFDSANNKCTGVNLTTAYMALAITTEDPIVVSQTAADKFNAPLFDSTSLQINDNDILLNLYGDLDHYKTFPDIGEDIKDGILCAVRRERKEDEALYAQSREHLREIMISDDKYMLNGKVVDIEVHCNNPEKLKNSMYNQQISHYYDMKLEYCANIVKEMEVFVNKKFKLTYQAEKLYYDCLWTIQGKQSIADKVFSNIDLKITTMNVIPLRVGDKITDRYGGKGVISAVLPDERMPQYPRYHGDGTFTLEPVDAIYNSSTIVNRENPGQSFETEITYVGGKILERVSMILDEAYTHGSYDDQGIIGQCENLIYDYLNILNKEEAQEFQEFCNYNDTGTRVNYLESMISDGAIYLCLAPMSSGVNIDTLTKLYEQFPWVDQTDVYVCINDSRGNIRRVKARRKMIIGKKYTHRLKQFAEEKFSAVSLASTNIRSENTKSKANKYHKAAHATTPVRFGDMEFLDMMHANGDILIEMLMILSASPQARREFEKLLIGDPFVRDIRIPEDATSRQVEKVDVYLKTIGIALQFTPVRKVRNKIKQRVITLINNQHKNAAMMIVDPEIRSKIKEIAMKRMVSRGRNKTKRTAMHLVDHRTAQVLSSFPEVVQKEIFCHKDIIKNTSEVVHLIEKHKDDPKFKSPDALTKFLIEADPVVKKHRPIRFVPMSLVNPNLPMYKNQDKM